MANCTIDAISDAGAQTRFFSRRRSLAVRSAVADEDSVKSSSCRSRLQGDRDLRLGCSSTWHSEASHERQASQLCLATSRGDIRALREGIVAVETKIGSLTAPEGAFHDYLYGLASEEFDAKMIEVGPCIKFMNQKTGKKSS